MVDKRIIEQTLIEQKEELSEMGKMNPCARREEVLVDLESNMAQVVIGVRRSGKSMLCYNVLKNHNGEFAYVNFDDERLFKLTSEDLNTVLEVLYKVYGNFTYLFIDEIQNIEGWHLFVNRLLRQRMHVLITGSNAKLLSGELATYLTGRNEQIELYPFSFVEFCQYKGIDIDCKTTKAEAYVRRAFDEYLVQGGFPELLHGKNKVRYIGTLIEGILKRDIEQRHAIRYREAFEKLAHHLMNTVPVTVVENSLASVVELKSNHTVNNYIGFLKQAYLLLGLRKYSLKSRQRIRAEKLYPIDVALMDGRQNALVGENKGWRLETIVYIELLRRNSPTNRSVFYYKSNDGYEVDFVVCRTNSVEEIYQVCYDMTSDKTRKREFRGLLAASRETACDSLYLITDCVREDVVLNGKTIHVIPAYDWLLHLPDTVG